MVVLIPLRLPLSGCTLKATVSMPDTVILYPGESYQLNPQGNLLYYSWFPTVGLSPNAAVSNPIASPTVNTRYY